MENPKFLEAFSSLTNHDEKVVKGAIGDILNILHHDTQHDLKTPLGTISQSLSYAINRLLKGLSSPRKEARLGFSLCFTALLRQYKQIEASALYQMFLKMDHSGLTSNELKAAKILVMSCLVRSDRALSHDMTQELVQFYAAKENLRESITDILIAMATPKGLLKQLQPQNDINYYKLSYSFSKSPENVINSAVKSKLSVLKSTYKTLPRLHGVWNMILEAGVNCNKLDYVWSHFIDIEVEEKKLYKHIEFQILVLEKLLKYSLNNLEFVLTKRFLDDLQMNVSSKKFKLHDVANTAKKNLLSYIAKHEIETEPVLNAVFRYLPDAKFIDLPIRVAEEIIKKMTSDELRLLIETISGFTEDKAGQFAVQVLSFMIENKEEIRKDALYAMFKYLNKVSEPLRSIGIRKFLNLLINLSNESILDVYKWWISKDSGFENKPTAKKILKEVQALNPNPASDKPVEKLGKRAPQDLSLLSSDHISNIQKLILVLGFENLIEPSELSLELLEKFKSITALSSPKKKGKEGNPIDEFIEELLNILWKPGSYIREAVSNTFKSFVSELSHDLLSYICEGLKFNSFESPEAETKNHDLALDIDQEELIGEDLVIEDATELGDLLEGPTQEEGNTGYMIESKENYNMRVTYLLENVIKFSQDTAALISIYETLFEILKTPAGRDKSFLSRCAGLLEKLQKSKIEVTAENKERVEKLLRSMLGSALSNDNFSNSLTKPILNLSLHISKIDIALLDSIFNDCLVKYFSAKNAKSRLNLLRSLLSNTSLSLPTVTKLLIKHSTESKSRSTCSDCLELLKLRIKKEPFDGEIFSRLCSSLKSLLKSEMKPKHKNKLLKPLLVSLICFGKKEQSGSCLLSFLSRKQEKLSKFVGVSSIIKQYQKSQITK
jgi:hypothetical protein